MHIKAPSSPTILSRTMTEPGAQPRVVEAWLAASRAWPDLPGFVAGALLRSLDDARVVAYLQFEPGAVPLLPVPNLDAQAILADAHHYAVVTLEAPPEATPAPLTITRGDTRATLINIFDTTPPHQQQLVDLWLSAGKSLTQHAGFLAAALHRSTDGTRVVNYAHWQSASDWQDVVRQHRQDFERFRPLGQSDPHLYEVVHLVEAAH